MRETEEKPRPGRVLPSHIENPFAVVAQAFSECRGAAHVGAQPALGSSPKSAPPGQAPQQQRHTTTEPPCRALSTTEYLAQESQSARRSHAQAKHTNAHTSYTNSHWQNTQRLPVQLLFCTIREGKDMADKMSIDKHDPTKDDSEDSQMESSPERDREGGAPAGEANGQNTGATAATAAPQENQQPKRKGGRKPVRS